MGKALSADVELLTPLGVISIALAFDHAPRTARHFESLVNKTILDKPHFYRVVRADRESSVGGIDIVQGGLGWERAEESPTVAHESTLQTGLSHSDGAVSMARSSEADAGSEFFICIGDQSVLDARGDGQGAESGFAVFGQVVHGMEVVRHIHVLDASGDPPGGDERFRGQFLKDYIPFECTIRNRK